MFSIEVQGLASVRQRVRSLPKQFRFAAAQALNAVAFQAARRALPDEMAKVFDRPTPFILRAPWYRKATPELLVAEIGVDKGRAPGYAADQLSSGVVRGGKSTVDPANVLRPEVVGGGRRLKRFEVALQRVGILPAGYAIVPGAAAPRDAYGNVPGPFLVRLLSYLQVFGEQGYRANMTEKNRRRLAGRAGPRVGPPRRYAHIGGVEYFVSYGKLRSNERGTPGHLKPGIWQRSGTHGSDVKPVLLFVRQPRYEQRLRMAEVVARTVQAQLPAVFHQRLQGALRTAR